MESPFIFDDGKIEAVIEQVKSEEIIAKITQAKDRGSKLKADKGINLPLSQLNVSGLTSKDREDLQFVVGHADAINFSFVNSAEDVNDLHRVLDNLNADLGIILKIETQERILKFTFHPSECNEKISGWGDDSPGEIWL